MGVTIEQYRARIWCHNIKNNSTSIQVNESPFLSGRFLIKGRLYFIYTCFWWLCYYYLTGWRSNSRFDYNSFSHSRWYSIPTCKYVVIDPPDGPSLVIYGNALPFTTNSTFLTNQLYIQRKSHNVCYIQSCYIADTCTERATHFRLSSGRHMHALRAYFYT